MKQKVLSMKRTSVLLCVLVFLSMLLNSCGNVLQVAYAQEEPRYGGTMVIAVTAEPSTLMPLLSGIAPDHYVCGQIFSALVKYNADYIIEPFLAKSWDVSADGKTFMFYLCDNVTWHDGEKFTSADVKYTFELIKEENLVGAGMLADVESIETPDDYTVIIHLKELVAKDAFLSCLIGTAVGCTNIIPKHLYENTDIRENEYNMKPIGTGPFKFSKWVKGSHIELIANPDYFQGRPYLDKIIIKFISEIGVRTAAFEAGEVDFIETKADELDRLKALPGKDVYILVEPGVWYIGIHNDRFPIPVRKAMYLALNRTEIIEKIHLGYCPVATSTVSSVQEYWYNPNVAAMYPLEGDVDEANRILDEAGYKRGKGGIRFKTDCLVAPWVFWEDVLLMAREMWKKIGIDVEIVLADFAVVNDLIYQKKDYNLCIWGSTVGPDPSMIYHRYHSDYIVAGGKNWYPYNNSEVDRLLEEQAKELDPEKRRELIWKIQEITMDELIYFPLYETARYYSYNTEFQGLWGKTGGGCPYVLMYPWHRVWWVYGESKTTVELAETVESITMEVSELANSLEVLSSRLEATSKDLAESIGDVSTSIDTMSTLVGTVRDEVKDEVTGVNESIAKLQSTVGMLQTLLAITLIVAIISVITPLVRKS